MENYRKQLTQAIQYAIESNYDQFEYCQYVIGRREKAKAICLYGTGHFFNDYIQSIRNFDYVCDSNPEKWGKEFAGRRCISPDELQGLESCVTFIMAGNYAEIKKSLDEKGIENYFFGDLFMKIYDKKYGVEWFQSNFDRILNTLDLFEDEKSRQVYTNVICNRIAPQFASMTFHEMEERGEYFETGILKLSKNECYLDGGAFDGDTIKKFMEAVQGKYDAIYAFEMDEVNYYRMIENTEWLSNPKNHFFHKGLSDKQQVVGMISAATGSHIEEMGNTQVEIDSIDSVLADKKVTFIKMDIEGAEMAALIGGEETIRAQHPKLAVSVYHRLSDLWEVPRFIKGISPKYKIYLRHHTAIVWDTDCYAYIEE